MKQLLTCTLAAAFLLANDPAYEKVEDKNRLQIETPALQKRETEKIRLRNGLEVLLISDPDVDQSAAAVSVSVGSWNDPEQYPGMAHFLEHMLFMGSEAYPEEDGFMKYVKEHQGLVNAYTTTEHTVYMFSITNEDFPSGLNYFSHLFRDPLFDPSGVGRELHAVDQEHAKNIENDGWRVWQIMKELGNQDHPFTMFSTGNADTLGNIPREAVVEWFKEHYSANQMHLVVYSPLSMDALKELVIKDFSPIVNFEAETLPAYDQVTSPKQHGNLIYINPIKDLRTLSLVWELPRTFAVDQDTKAAEVVAYTLGSGSRGSLENVLKNEHLAEGVSVSVDRLSPEHIIFSLDIALTKLGVKDVDLVIERCFEGINLLTKAGVPPYIFNEMQSMSKLNYAFQSRSGAFSYVSKAADELVYEDLSTYPQKTRTASTFFPQKIHELLATLTPESCTFFLLASPKLTGVTPNKKEKWMGAEYAIRPINREYLLSWKKADGQGRITIPHPNPFIPTHLHIVNQDKPMEQHPIPMRIVNNAKGEVYYCADTRYRVPDIAWQISLKSPLIDGSPKSTALLDLYVRSFYEDLSTTLSEADRAGLGLRMQYKDMKVDLFLNGYSEKAPELLSYGLDAMRTLRPSQEQFNVYKDSLLSQYKSREKGLLFTQAIEMMDHSLFSDAPTSQELFEVMQSIQYDDFMHFARALFRVAYTEAMLTGNMVEETARTAWRSIEKTLAYEGYPKEAQIDKQVLLLPKNEGPFMIQAETSMLGSSALLAIQEGPFSLENKAASIILGNALSNDFFDTLRTKQQTGYIAKGWNKEVEKQLFQFLGVQSSTHTPSELLSRFELFIEDYTKDFVATFPEARFDSIRDSLILALKQPPTNLDAQLNLLYRLAFNRDGNFHFVQDMIATLDTLPYKTLQKFTYDVLSRQNSQRLAILLEGQVQGDFRYRSATTDLLRDRGRYVTSSMEGAPSLD